MKKDIELKIQHTNPELTGQIRAYLKEKQDAGVLKFQMKTRRICDFCKKELKEGDDFVTLPNGLDKC